MSDDVCIFNRLPDVEATFRFSGTRSRPYADGYRPAHRVTDNYLTTGRSPLQLYKVRSHVGRDGNRDNYVSNTGGISSLSVGGKNNCDSGGGSYCWICDNYEGIESAVAMQ